jgi:hypothetical protein
MIAVFGPSAALSAVLGPKATIMETGNGRMMWSRKVPRHAKAESSRMVA